jgi:sortase (surface protein transpeptidase)
VAQTKKTGARQPVKHRLPAREGKSNSRGRQAKRVFLHLSSSSDILISLRKFKTQKSRRSKKNRQLVIPTLFFATKEIAITKLPAQARPKQRSSLRYLKPATIIPLSLGVIGVIYFASNLTQPAKVNVPTSSKGHVLAAQSTAKTMAASTPVKLRIDKIGISAPIIGLGLKADGSLDTPPGPSEVGWYTGSPTPGQLGPAVIDGHVDWIDNVAVFWRLRELVPGDTFAVDRADGSTATFKVTAIQEFPQNNFPSKEVYGSINYAGIRLITCGGEFDTSTGHYNQNIVVFGSLI